MGLTFSTRQVGWILLALTVAAVGLTATMVASSAHAMDPSHYAPAVIMLLITGSWPFVNGWRPFGGRSLKTCGSCGVQWRPAEEGTHACPACGGTGLGEAA